MPADPTHANREREAACLKAAYLGNHQEVLRLLEECPALADSSIHLASMLGEHRAVEIMLHQEPALATRKSGPKDFEPLLYASFSRLHIDHPERRDGIVRVANILLAHGANPNTSYLCESDSTCQLPALWAATCESNNPALARVLLEAGANPNDGESVYHAAEKNHLECLDLLLEFGANVSGKVFERWRNAESHVLESLPQRGSS